MQILSSPDFWTIVAIVVSALGVARAAKADRQKIHRETERRREAGEQRLEGQINSLRQEMKGNFLAHRQDVADALAAHKQDMADALAAHRQEVGARIDRLEDRVDQNHREVTAGLAELKAEVSALGARLDERSYPRQLAGTGLSSTGADVASGAVREAADPYSADEPSRGAAGAPEGRGPRPGDGSRD